MMALKTVMRTATWRRLSPISQIGLAAFYGAADKGIASLTVGHLVQHSTLKTDQARVAISNLSRLHLIEYDAESRAYRLKRGA